MQLWMLEPGGFSESAMTKLRDRFQVDTGFQTNNARQELIEKVKFSDILWVRLAHRLDRRIISEMKTDAVIVCPATGTDHIDVKACEDYSITLLCLKDEQEFLKSVRATSELAFGLMLALVRRIGDAHAHVLAGGWDRDLFQGTELFKKTLGIVGLGRLGRILAEYGQSFGMDVIYYDPYVEDPDFKRVDALADLAKHSDVVSIHVKLNPSTEGLIGESFFDEMKPDAIFINTSRGGIVDEYALVKALEENRIAAAGLDVLSGEPDVDAMHPLVAYANRRGNVIITPHIGGNTVESFEKTEHFMVDRLFEYLDMSRP